MIAAVIGLAGSIAAGADRPGDPAAGVAGEQAGQPSARGSVAPDRLERSIREVISRPEHAWRGNPPERPEAEESKSFMQDLAERIREWLEKMRGKDRSVSRDERHLPLNSGGGWAGGVRAILYVLVAALVAALAVMLYRYLKGRHDPVSATASPVVSAEPDLSDENLTAEQLPESGWMDLADRMMAAGDRRLALRAMYLASLARLAEGRLIAIARFKSNRDYQRELARRAHSVPDLNSAFASNVDLFEDAWYGMHDVTDTMVVAFATNHERISGLVQA